jgi:hypothetical protein
MVELKRMRWYDPKGGSFEWREVPMSDEDALSLLGDSPYPQSCTDTYLYWRELGATITAALLRAGEQAKVEGRDSKREVPEGAVPQVSGPT